ncbi:MAG: L,D-transpeptidase [Elusimicrobiota bacterium]|jgi:hypothetical protein
MSTDAAPPAPPPAPDGTWRPRLAAAGAAGKLALRRLHSGIYSACHRPLSALETGAAGLALLALLTLAHIRMSHRLQAAQADSYRLNLPIEAADTALETIDNLNTLKAEDIEQMKSAMVGLAKKQKKYYEDRLALSEERRQLEKQLDLIETHLLVDPALGRLKIMRADQAVKEYPFSGMVYLGGPSPSKPLRTAFITAKEYFAHPQRGDVKIQDGKIVWTPPQIGNVSRSDALGQYVVFTSTSLILHAPSTAQAAHAAYPHWCLPMTVATAKKIYDAVYIGTRISVAPGR